VQFHCLTPKQKNLKQSTVLQPACYRLLGFPQAWTVSGFRVSKLSFEHTYPTDSTHRVNVFFVVVDIIPVLVAAIGARVALVSSVFAVTIIAALAAQMFSVACV
jgi:hypothetical protein